MCYFDVDRTGFPLVAAEEDEIFFHFFPITRVQFEEAIASGWLIEDKQLGMSKDAAADMIFRGEVFFPEYLDIDRDTPEHAMPIEAMVFPGGYKTLCQLARNGLQEIEPGSLYSFYLTNLKQREYCSLIRWLGGNRFYGRMPAYGSYDIGCYKFFRFHVRQLIKKILELEGLNPRARNMLELFNKYMGKKNGLPRDIFEMTGNYIKRDSEKVSDFGGGENEPVPRVDEKGYPLYYPVIVGNSQLWPHIPTADKVRHLKVECHPLVSTRGIYRRKKK
jgi:hypothetical protein